MNERWKHFMKFLVKEEKDKTPHFNTECCGLPCPNEKKEVNNDEIYESTKNI